VGFDPQWCAQTPRYDRETILKYESQYFLQAFAHDYCGARIDSAQLAAELAVLAERAAGAGPLVFLHRDFQSRNLLLRQGRIRVVDFQGGRLGPAGYDLASLLIDPYVGLSDQEKAGIFEHYLSLARERGLLEEDGFRRDYPVLALQRNLQVLGAFGFLTMVKGRPGFARHIPPALAGLKARLAGPEFRPYPALRELAAGLNPLGARP
jgi:aminoglycoside/choline kinase family phosphotransferase